MSTSTTVAAVGGFTLAAQLHDSHRTTVHRAKDQDGKPVIVKVLSLADPTEAEVLDFTHEFEIGHSLDSPHLVGARTRLQVGANPAIVFDDIGGASLDALLQGDSLSIEQGLRVGIGLASGLVDLHAQGIVHNDINPSNTVVDLATDVVALIDFGLAAKVQAEGDLSELSWPVGTLAYTSPERTGRTGRAVDHRSDLYALGVTLYEILLGERPFSSNDPLELIHSHIARTPRAPIAVNRAIPKTLSAIIMTLLQKQPGARYQTARGLLHDLQRCHDSLHDQGAVEAFELRQHDTADRFSLSQKPFGRAAELSTLLDGFQRVLSGPAETVFLKGPEGAGKSTLANEVRRVAVRQRGYFIQGTFDETSRDRPYSALADAFGSLVRQILAESGERIDLWRERLTEALGDEARVIVDFLPDLGHVLGETPAVEDLAAQPAQTRFSRCFREFVGSITSWAPLVVFLDDLQWADAASLAVVGDRIEDPSIQRLLLIGGLQTEDAKIDAEAPVAEVIGELQEAGTKLTILELGPLTANAVTEMLAESLGTDRVSGAGLAKLVVAKTAGNPLFVREFLTHLNRLALIRFDAEAGAWTWDMEAIEALEVSANVADMMATQLSELSEFSRNTLHLAAHVGSVFDVGTVALVSPPRDCGRKVWNTSPPSIFKSLLTAVDAGYVVPVSSQFEHARTAPDVNSDESDQLFAGLVFRFLHDRVRAAARGLYDDDESRAVRYRMGRLMLDRTPPQELEGHIYDVLAHLNAAAALVQDEDERYEIARLNLRAAHKSEKAAAFKTAMAYYQSASALLPEDHWAMEPRLSFEIYVGAFETARITGNLAFCVERFEGLYTHARTRAEKTRLRITMIQVCSAQSEYAGAFQHALDALALFDIAIPEADEDAVIRHKSSVKRVYRRLGTKPFESLLEYREMEDNDQRLVLEILTEATVPSFWVSEAKAKLFTAMIADISLEYGVAPTTAYGLTHFAGLEEDIDDAERKGYRLARVALALARHYGRDGAFAKSSAMVGVLGGPDFGFTQRAEIVSEGYQFAVDTGDHLHRSFNGFWLCWTMFFKGTPLPELVDFATEVIEALTRFGLIEQTTDFHLMRAQALALQSAEGEPSPYRHGSANHLSVSGFLGSLGLDSEYNRVGMLGLLQARMGLLTGPSLEAFQAAQAAGQQFDGGTFGMMTGEVRLVLALQASGLALQARLDHGPDTDVSVYLEAVESAAALMTRYSELCPEDYIPSRELVFASKARLQGHVGPALDHFEAAIDSAAQAGFVHLEGIAAEYMGRYLVDLGHPRAAASYLAIARHAFQRWGAGAKVQALDAQFGSLLASGSSRRADSNRSVGSSSSDRVTSNLDITTIMKAAQAVSGEVHVDRLLDTLLDIIIQNAGAERAVIILRQESGWTVGAERDLSAEQSETILVEVDLASYATIPHSVVGYTSRTQQALLIDDAQADGTWSRDADVVARGVRSAMCVPCVSQGRLVAVLYIENNVMPGAFAPERLELVSLLASQAAISLLNARLYDDLRAAGEQLKQSNVRLEGVNRVLEHDAAAEFGMGGMEGASPAEASLHRDVELFAPTDSPVLIRGERGTRKERVARALHAHSNRKDQTFVKVNCRVAAANSEGPTNEYDSLKSPLERFALADMGTLFLDEVDALSTDMQEQVWTLLERGTIERHGVEQSVDIRVFASTSEDLTTRTRSGSFRQDLRQRLSTHAIRVPPLRERPEDIPLLVTRLLSQLSQKLGKRLDGVTDETMQRLQEYRWPGNVTELLNVLERAAIVADGAILEIDEALELGIEKGVRLGSYQLVDRIGVGGMGEVWRANHRLLRRAAAVKIIPPEKMGTQTAEQAGTLRRRFEREAQATAQLRSANTVELFDYGVNDAGTFYYVMELLEGLDLDSLVNRFGAISSERVIHILKQVCKSLAEAHELGLVHRDIKAANIYLCKIGIESDFVKVLDFGLVRSLDIDGGETRLTADNTFGGTPAYIAPEMALDANSVDWRADIYALGCVGYWLITGGLVFQETTALKMIMKHVSERPIPPSELTELEVPAELEAIIMECLQKSPADRPQSARELAQRLDAIELPQRWTEQRRDLWWRNNLEGV